MPNVGHELMRSFDELSPADYNRKKLTQILRKNKKAAGVENEEQIADLVQKLQAYRGYNRNEIKSLLEKIRTAHGSGLRMGRAGLEKFSPWVILLFIGPAHGGLG